MHRTVGHVNVVSVNVAMMLLRVARENIMFRLRLLHARLCNSEENLLLGTKVLKKGRFCLLQKMDTLWLLRLM
jgi:hypothetical protein